MRGYVACGYRKFETDVHFDSNDEYVGNDGNTFLFYIFYKQGLLLFYFEVGLEIVISSFVEVLRMLVNEGDNNLKIGGICA